MEALRPVQQRYGDIQSDPAELDRVLLRGRDRAAAVAHSTLARVKMSMGFLLNTPSN